MGFLSALFGGGDKLRDPARAHPELGPLIEMFEKLDGRPAQTMFDRTHGRWDLRTVLVDTTAEHYFGKFPEAARDRMIEGLIPQPPPGFWVMARAMWHINEGWKARGSGSASTVSDQGWSTLAQRCKAAQQDLATATAVDSADPTPHTLAIRVALGLSDRKLGDAAYAQAVHRDPHGYEPHARYLGLISGRWLGTHDEMLATARAVAARAPDASDAASLPVLAHYDRYSHTCVFDKDHAGAVARLRDPSVLGEVAHACQRSVDAPGYQLTAQTIRIRQRAAVLFLEAGDRDRCRAQLAACGDAWFKDAWWQTGPDPDKRYTATRKELGLK